MVVETYSTVGRSLPLTLLNVWEKYREIAYEEEVPELIPFLAMAGLAGVRRSELVREYAEDQVLKWDGAGFGAQSTEIIPPST